MKNILLFLIGVFTCLQTFAQDPNPDLFQTWYLTNLSDEIGDNIIVANIAPPIHPIFILTEFLDISGIVCNEYGGIFTYNAADDILFLEEFSPCLCGTCNNPPTLHVTLEERYFEFFFTGGLYSYAITDGPQGDKILTLDSQIFSTLIFSNTFLGVTDQKMNAINVFPNPVSDELFITSEGMVIEKIVVYSMSGQTVLTSENITDSIDVSRLFEGLYFIEVSSSEGKVFRSL